MEDPNLPLLGNPKISQDKGLNPASGLPAETRTFMEELSKFNPNSHREFTEHESDVQSCAISSDNRTIYSGSSDTKIIIRDSDGNHIRTLESHRYPVNVLILIEKNSQLISVDQGGILCLWDTSNFSQLKELKVSETVIYSYTLSSGQKYFALCGEGPEVSIWKTDTLELVRNEKINTGYEFSAGIVITKKNDFIIISGQDETLKIFKTNTGELERTENLGKIGVVNTMVLCSDDALLAVGTRNNIIKIFKYPSMSEYHVFYVFEDRVRGLIPCSNSTHLIAFSADKRIKILNIEQKTEECSIEGSKGSIWSGCLSKDNSVLITGSSDSSVRRWDLGKTSRVKSTKIHQNSITDFDISSDEKYIATSSVNIYQKDRKFIIRVSELESLENHFLLEGHSAKIWSIRFSPNVQLLASGSDDGTVRVWDLKTKACIAVNEYHKKPVYSVCFARNDELIISGSTDSKVIVFDRTNEKILATLSSHYNSILAVRLTPCGTFLVSSSADCLIKIWDISQNFQEVNSISSLSIVHCCSISPDQKFFVFGEKNNIKLYDWQTKTKVSTLIKHSGTVNSLDFSHDSSLLASCSVENSIIIWNTAEERVEFMMNNRAYNINKVQFSRDSRFIYFSCSNGTLGKWDIFDRDTLEIFDNQSSIENFSYLFNIKKKKAPTQSQCDITIGRIKINLAHIYCYFGYDKLLKTAFDHGIEFKKDTNGYSPLYYALKRKNQNCIDKILLFFIELNETNFKKFISFGSSIKEDFKLLIMNSSEHLPQFLDNLFFLVPGLSYLSRSDKKNQMVKYLKSKKINIEDFKAEEGPEVVDGRADISENIYTFRTLPFTIPSELGSSSSIELLNSINNFSNSKIMQTKWILTYIQDKWNNVLLLIKVFALLRFLYIVITCIIITDSYYNNYISVYINLWLQIPFIIILSLFITVEIIQFYLLKCEYFGFWNTIDLLLCTLSTLWTTLTFFYPQSELYYLALPMVMLILIRGIEVFRAFDSTRFYIRLISKAIKDSFPFLIIFVYSTVSFGMIYFVSIDSNNAHFSDIWTAPYELNMGELDRANSENFMIYIYFLGASYINVIIMLNLLISILGNTFDNFQMNAIEFDCIEMADLVLEIETMMFWRRGANEQKYIHVCELQNTDSVTQWDGKIKTIINQIKESVQKAESNYSSLSIKLDKYQKEVNMKLDKLLNAQEK